MEVQKLENVLLNTSHSIIQVTKVLLSAASKGLKLLLSTYFPTFGPPGTMKNHSSTEEVQTVESTASVPPDVKRRYPRIGLPRGMSVAWQAGGERIVSRVGTLGLGGIFIHTRIPPAIGEVVKLVFDVPGGEVRARAVVRSSTVGRGMGVEFTAMQPEARARLTQLLRRLASL